MSAGTRNISAVLENLDEAIGFVEGHAEEFGFGPARTTGLAVALEEAFVNICNYAYPEGPGEIELSCSETGNDFIVEIVDGGVPFDILSLDEPDTSAAMEEREIGGLGVFLIRKFTDGVTYRRENGRNRLTLLLHRDDGARTEGDAGQ